MTLTVITREAREAFKLDSAILVYGGAGKGYASVHSIAHEGDKESLDEGHPVTVKALRETFQVLAPETVPKAEFIPPTVLAQAPDILVWWMPPAMRNVWFDQKELGGQRSACVPVSGLVFAVCRGDWFVYAVAGDQRPTPESPLFRAPFYNVWDSGRICAGNVSVPQGSLAERTDLWEKAFFESWFTHSNVDKLVKYRGGATAFWKQMLAGGFGQSFPMGTLVPLNTTLQGLINGANNRKD